MPRICSGGRPASACSSTSPRRSRRRRKTNGRFSCLAKLHGKPLSQITTAEIVAECHRFEAQGKRESAHRVGGGFAKRVFRYARQSGYTNANPTVDIDGALQPIEGESSAATTDPKPFGELLRAIGSLSGGSTRYAPQLLALTAVRPGELRQMEWSEVDTAKAEWLLPLKRTKMRKTP